MSSAVCYCSIPGRLSQRKNQLFPITWIYKLTQMGISYKIFFLNLFYQAGLFYSKHTGSNTLALGQLYVANTAESFGDCVIRWIKVGWSLSHWTSPLLLPFLYHKGTFTVEGLQTLSSYLLGVGVIYVLAIIVRAVGRFLNNDYTTFLHVLDAALKSFTAANKKRLAQYDFDFSSWPVDFSMDEVNQENKGRQKVTALWRPKRDEGILNNIKTLPCRLIAYISVHTFGRRMLYPGTTALIQTLMAPALIQGRAKLIEENGGVRAKLRTEDGNDVDTMFVDRRNSSSSENAKKLVICCEGNSGFYEVGCMCTPLDAGYSVLGWNHPGFWGSTGAPYPSQEQSAIDVVMQYAIHRLGFLPDHVILFAWSIGGYTATWAAMNYPDIKYVILDATFDDILPLAYTKLPSSWGGLVEMAVRNHLNLNNAEQLCRYPGPVLLIRRTKDEMITTLDPSVIAANRGNDLAIRLLKHRYPNAVDDSSIEYVRDYLSKDHVGQASLKQRYNVNDDVYKAAISYGSIVDQSIPSQLGIGLSQENKVRLALFLISKYMEDYDSTHCTPLPSSYFHAPWTDSTLKRSVVSVSSVNKD